MESFKALRVHKTDDGVESRLEDLNLDDLSAGEVVVRTAFSSVNYKDALAITGKGKIMRDFPLVAGIDVAGTVEQSDDERFNPGDQVVVTGAGLGEERDGGYAEYARVPGDAVIALPEGLSLEESMVLGTAGFTAALAVVRMEDNGQAPSTGPIAVTGASGGVGSLAVDMLAATGYEVHAITGKLDAGDYLRRLGAAEIVDRRELDLGGKPLESTRWGGAVDNLGGHMLGWFTRTVKPFGNIGSIGLAAGIKLETTVMPFILRGVSLLGINSVLTPMALRERVWERLAGDLKPNHLDEIAAGSLSLDEVQGAMPQWIEGKATGRTVVRVGD
jgi:NADPH2:quinone reductase